jgi:hypothetical protein
MKIIGPAVVPPAGNGVHRAGMDQTPDQTPPDQNPPVLVLVRDLMFSSRITAAARAAGWSWI